MADYLTKETLERWKQRLLHRNGKRVEDIGQKINDLIIEKADTNKNLNYLIKRRIKKVKGFIILESIYDAVGFIEKEFQNPLTIEKSANNLYNNPKKFFFPRFGYCVLDEQIYIGTSLFNIKNRGDIFSDLKEFGNGEMIEMLYNPARKSDDTQSVLLKSFEFRDRKVAYCEFLGVMMSLY